VNYRTASRAERRNPLVLAAVRMDFRCLTRRDTELAITDRIRLHRPGSRRRSVAAANRAKPARRVAAVGTTRLFDRVVRTVVRW
jgi:hypothetical protein